MKPTLLYMTLLGLACSAAHAQSSLTVFGTLDLNLRHVKNGAGSLASVSSHGSSTSKIGLRGEEDLGGGLKAAFWLESQADPDTGSAGGSNGTATAFWNRRATISLSGNFGELRLGRDYVPTHSTPGDFDPMNTNGVGNALNLMNQDSLGSGIVTQVRANNAVGYFLPAGLGGVYGNLMLSAGEGLPGQKLVGGRIGYAADRLKVQVAHARTQTTENGPKFKQSSVAASYDFGIAKLTSFVNRNEYAGKKAMIYLIGTIMPVGSAGEVRAAYMRRDTSGAGTDADDAKQIAIGYLHHLSKRTALYGNLARLQNDGGAAFRISGGPNVNGLTGFTNTGFEVGVRHHF